MDGTLNNSTIADQSVFTKCSKQKLWCQESFRSAIYTPAIVAIFFNVVLALTAVLGNGLLFVAYYPNESLRRPVNTILLSLAVTDFLTGAVSQPIFIYEKILILTNCTVEICLLVNLKNFTMILLLGATLLNLSLSTLDRYIAVLHSFRYLELVTNKRVLKVLLSSWLGFIAITAAGVLTGKPYLSALIIFPPNVIFIVILYYKIYKEIRRLEANPVVAVNETEEARKARERKSAKTVGIILGLLFLCYVPIIIFLVPFIRTELVGKNPVFNQKLLYITLTITASNSSLNVFVYFWRNAEIRSAMLKVVSPITQRFNNEVYPA